MFLSDKIYGKIEDRRRRPGLRDGGDSGNRNIYMMIVSTGKEKRFWQVAPCQDVGESQDVKYSYIHKYLSARAERQH